ncbi:MAG: ACT domain-containing protein, partial [Chthoniobacterales bacterium]
MVKIVQQLALFLENSPGTLAKVCDALAEAKINIYAMSITDSVDHAIVRLVLSDPQR